MRRISYAGGAYAFAASLTPLRRFFRYPSKDAHVGDMSRVVIARNELVRDGAFTIKGDAVMKLLDGALEAFFEKTPAVEVWRDLFSPRDIVGIKINCLAGRGLSTRPELVEAIIERLLSAGVPKNHIIVWDRLNDDLERAGYKVRTEREDIRYIGNDYSGYDTKLRVFGSIGSLVSRVVTDICTALINVPVLKDHGIVGVTLGLKNYFGAIHNPNKYHDSIGDPYVADVNMIPELRRKTRLTICDGITAQYEGGPPHMPQWSWPYNGLLVAGDMVALDTVGWRILEEKRREMGMPSLAEIGREPTYIATAADESHKLGTNAMEHIERIYV